MNIQHLNEFTAAPLSKLELKKTRAYVLIGTTKQILSMDCNGATMRNSLDIYHAVGDINVTRIW